MLKRKFFIKYENESNEQFENRINEFLNENDKQYNTNDSMGNNTFVSSNGTILCILFYHLSESDSKKQKVGF